MERIIDVQHRVSDSQTSARFKKIITTAGSFNSRKVIYNQSIEKIEKYHQRSNVETGFHMVKQRFGDSLLTKNFQANKNELLTKFLCHNLTVLIQEAFELNINVDFESCVKMAELV